MLEHLKYWRSVKYWSIVKHINNVIFSLCGSPYDLGQAKKLNQGPLFIQQILIWCQMKILFWHSQNLSFGHECRAKLHTMQLNYWRAERNFEFKL